MAKKRPRKWIQKALRKHKKGALHRQLGAFYGRTFPMDKPIPLWALQGAIVRGSKLLQKRAHLALTLRSLKR